MLIHSMVWYIKYMYFIIWTLINMASASNQHNKDEGANSESDDDKSDEGIWLGFLKSIEYTRKRALEGHAIFSKVGGCPTIGLGLNNNFSYLSQTTCGICNGPLQFLLQVFHDKDDLKKIPTQATLVFICSKMTCLQEDQHQQYKQLEENPRRSIKALRVHSPHILCSTSENEVQKGTSSGLEDETKVWPEMELFIDKEDNTNPIEYEDSSDDTVEVSPTTNDVLPNPLEDPLQTESDDEFESAIFKETQDLSLDEQVWEKFMATIARAQDQVLRVSNSLQAMPLWLSLQGQPNDSNIPTCIHCGQQQHFGFQIMPQLLSFLDLDDDPNSLDWGTIVIYTCKHGCLQSLGSSYVEDFVWIQLHPDSCENIEAYNSIQGRNI